MKRRSILLGGGTAITGGLAGCLGGDETGTTDPDDDESENGTESDGTEPNGDAETTEREESTAERPLGEAVDLGVLLPVTGVLGSLGEPMHDAATLPAIQLADADVDLEVDVRTADTESDPATGVDAAQSLVDAGCSAIVGAASSPVTVSVAEAVLYPNDVVGVSPASTTADMTDMPGDYLLRTAPNDVWQSEALAELAATEEDATTAGIVHYDTDHGGLFADGFADAFEAFGGTVTDRVSIAERRPTYDSELEAALGADPDVLVVAAYPDDGRLLFDEYYDEFDDDRPILVDDGLRSDRVTEAVDRPMSNVTGLTPEAVGPGAEAFEAMYTTEFGREPGLFTPHSYDAAAVLVLATVAARANDGTAISDAVREVANPGGRVVGPETLGAAVETVADGAAVEYRGASGRVAFDDAGDQRSVTFERFSFDRSGVRSAGTYEYDP